MRVSVCVSRETVDRGNPQRLEISRLPSRASWPSKHRSTSNARDTTWMTSPSPDMSPASIPCLLRRSERRPMRSPLFFPLCGIKFRLKVRLPQAHCAHNRKRIGMPDIRVITEVAGRVCALSVAAGESVGNGDDIAFVESMKMEIPVASPAAGKVKTILVALDEVIAEGQA